MDFPVPRCDDGHCGDGWKRGVGKLMEDSIDTKLVPASLLGNPALSLTATAFSPGFQEASDWPVASAQGWVGGTFGLTQQGSDGRLDGDTFSCQRFQHYVGRAGLARPRPLLTEPVSKLFRRLRTSCH